MEKCPSYGELFERAVKELEERGGSDIHFVPNQNVGIRVNGYLEKLPDTITPQDTVALATYLIDMLAPRHREEVLKQIREFMNVSFSVVYREKRFRVNIAYKTIGRNEGRYIVLREIKENPPKIDTLGFSAKVLSGIRRILNAVKISKTGGIFFVVGATGSGKSTTLASIVRELNETAPLNIITLEDPIEYVHEPLKAQIVQKEQGADFLRFAHGLRSALREDPDIILVGEIRDKETFKLALDAAETGHLVLTTLHTGDAVSTIERLVSMGDDNSKLVRDKISKTLRGILAQKLLPRKDGKGRVLAYEFLYPTLGIRNLIKDGKDGQVYAEMEQQAFGQTFEETLAQLVRDDKISLKVAFNASAREKELETKLRNYGIEANASQILSSETQGGTENIDTLFSEVNL